MRIYAVGYSVAVTTYYYHNNPRYVRTYSQIYILAATMTAKYSHLQLVLVTIRLPVRRKTEVRAVRLHLVLERVPTVFLQV